MSKKREELRKLMEAKRKMQSTIDHYVMMATMGNSDAAEERIRFLKEQLEELDKTISEIKDAKEPDGRD